MKKTIAVLLALMSLLTLFAACGKKPQPETTEPDANAVLTDSNVPLDVGADVGHIDPNENVILEGEDIPLE